MIFCIINESADPQITPAILSQIADAIQQQLNTDFSAQWGGTYCVTTASAADAPDEALKVHVRDQADQDGELGVHVDDDATVFWGPIAAAGGTLISGSTSLSAVLSHEILEAAGDPGANRWAENPADSYLYALEACDAVEAGSYTVNSVAVTDFVFPSFFDPDGAAPYHQLALLGTPTATAPFQTTPGGYQIYGDSPTNVQQVFGSAHADWRTKKGRRHFLRGIE